MTAQEKVLAAIEAMRRELGKICVDPVPLRRLIPLR